MDEDQSEQVLFIGGSRSFVSYHLLSSTIRLLIEQGILRVPFSIISGGAKGADDLAEKYANYNNIPFTLYEARWDLYGKSAGFKRNNTLVVMSDIQLFFWDGKSNGTRHAFNLAYKQNPDTTFIVFY
jgi:hypothetical protein